MNNDIIPFPKGDFRVVVGKCKTRTFGARLHEILIEGSPINENDSPMLKSIIEKLRNPEIQKTLKHFKDTYEKG